MDEVILNEQKIEDLTGRRPKYFRSGTVRYDEVAVKIVNEIGEAAVNFNVLGNAGATYTKEQVSKACLTAPPISILLFHMNHTICWLWCNVTQLTTYYTEKLSNILGKIDEITVASALYSIANNVHFL
ncbi:hypothetical protein K9O30_19555 [Clostridium bowmanii]|uniref:hypothetical protein n=1 Tax=Clostridium bowmanii TaxID=132925 RepID=UPI001C0CE491|nr:hypothetical protein [Clostridium bowmanii]MBU3191526.1 hypothetical protein [Clostridium bowmanii]MCA1075875.1 hypothetical protein [Clostridium bowmanii]